MIDFKSSSYDFSLPDELIAQRPHRPRDKSRLLVVERRQGRLTEKVFSDIVSFLEEGDCLVLNNTKVIKARVWGKKESGAKIEFLLLREAEDGCWECLARPAKRIKQASRIFFQNGCQAEIKNRSSSGLFYLKFSSGGAQSLIEASGEAPLPPYIKKNSDLEDYQTVYAKEAGAVAAPTAGLHFTRPLIEEIKNKGVRVVYVTLHCSLATFRPVKAKDIRDHKMSEEYVELNKKVADTINNAKRKKKKVFAVGTTSVRTLESAARGSAEVKPFSGPTGLYILPGYKFKVVDALLTNFHTPLSTNLILVASFSSLGLIKQAYSHAQAKKFRFFSFGDAMLIL